MAKAAARVRIPDQPALRTWEDVDNTLREIGLIDIDIEAMEAEFNRKVTDLKEQLARKAKPLQDRKELLSLRIKEFVEARRPELEPKKSRELNFGQVGFRQSTSIVLRNVKAIIAALKAKGMTDCIVVKEEVSKEALKKYDDQVLESVGAKRKVEDVFWFEVKRDALQRV